MSAPIPRGIVHTLRATDAAAADITQFAQLLHGEEREVFGDQAYWKEADRQAFAARGVRYRINRRPTPQAAERALADDQSRPLADPRLRRACISGRQTTVGFQQGEIPRLGQEPGARADHGVRCFRRLGEKRGQIIDSILNCGSARIACVVRLGV